MSVAAFGVVGSGWESRFGVWVVWFGAGGLRGGWAGPVTGVVSEEASSAANDCRQEGSSLIRDWLLHQRDEFRLSSDEVALCTCKIGNRSITGCGNSSS